MDVHTIQDQTHLKINTNSVTRLVEEFLLFHNVTYDEVAIHFVDTPTISKLHADFFDDPTTTDCISFPMDDADDEGFKVMGDIFVCPETATAYVAANGGNPYHEVTLYVVHGLLHLLGYDDIEEEDQLDMRAEEKKFLAVVNEKNLWICS